MSRRLPVFAEFMRCSIKVGVALGANEDMRLDSMCSFEGD